MHAKFWPWGMPWDAIYDYLGSVLFVKVQTLIDGILPTWPFAISRVDFWFFIIELVMRNPNLDIPDLDDGLFANLLIFDYL